MRKRTGNPRSRRAGRRVGVQQVLGRLPLSSTISGVRPEITMSTTLAPSPSALGLRSVKLLEGIPSEALEDIARQCRWRRFAPGQRIISRDAGDSDVYLIVSGHIRVTSFSASGRQVGYGEMHTGQWFGDFAAIDGLSRSADVDAIEETLVASMSPVLFRSLLHAYPDVCDSILRRLVACVRELTDRVYDFSTLGVQNRLHAELLRLAKQAGITGNSVRLDPAPKHSDIAGRISTYREQVSRELSEMAKQGLVQRSESALVIPDVARLERLVSEVRRLA